MSRIGALASSASQTFDIPYVPQYIQIGTPDNADAFDGLEVSANGVPLIQLTDGAQIRAIMQTEAEVMAAGANTKLGSRLLLATGRIGVDSIITIGNAGATITDVFANSTGKSPDRGVRRITTKPVVANNNLIFRDFDQVLFLPANLDSAIVEFENGFTEKMTAEELQGMYNANRNSEASGLVNGFVVVEGYRGPAGSKVKSIQIFASLGGSVDVVVCSWQQLG